MGAGPSRSRYERRELGCLFQTSEGVGAPMSRVVDRLAELGLELPTAPTPLASYVPAVHTGSLVFTSGQLPIQNGEMIATGLVHSDPDLAEVQFDLAKTCARIAILNALAAVSSVIGDLDAVVRTVRVVGYVASVPGFDAQPKVIDGASELLADVFHDAGQHARSAIGVSALPLNSPVEVELVVEVSGEPRRAW